MIIDHRNLSFTLLPEAALLYGSSLILADTHFGKSAAFRARGIPVPEGDTERDCNRIRTLLDRHQPSRLVIAGDFLHAPQGKSPTVLSCLSDFLSSLSCEVHLVLGNHDRKSGAFPSDWPIEIHRTFTLDRVVIVHEPDFAPAVMENDSDAEFAICGHIHPVVRIKDGKNTNFRSPCFWLQQDMIVLPSFGTFTGGAVVNPAEDDRIFVPLQDQVVELPREVL